VIRLKQVCVQLLPLAANVTLPTFAAEHRAEAPLLKSNCCVPPTAID